MLTSSMHNDSSGTYFKLSELIHQNMFNTNSNSKKNSFVLFACAHVLLFTNQTHENTSQIIWVYCYCNIDQIFNWRFHPIFHQCDFQPISTLKVM